MAAFSRTVIQLLQHSDDDGALGNNFGNDTPGFAAATRAANVEAFNS